MALGIWIGAAVGAGVTWASAYSYGWLAGHSKGRTYERRIQAERDLYSADLRTEEHNRRLPETHGRIGHICQPGCPGK